jgi:DNA polymerase III subunit gamma/tau
MIRMSYVVLARKYRPRTFADMVGQDAVVKALTHALEQQRLHHAYLFTGTRGIGKTTVSRILAKSLNCTGADGQGGITAQPCGVCTACTEIDADRYIDYIEMDAASNRGIDEIRDLLERAAYKPSVGRFKVFMIDEAHQLTKESFNALLKTLEEPPEYLKFVLATTDPEKMLPTVLSRCLQFNLRPMAPETVYDYLEHVLEHEGVAREPAALKLLARAARGSMRDALSLTDQAIAYAGGAVQADAVRAMLGSVDRGHAERFVRALAVRDGRAVLAGVDALRQHGLSAAGTLEELAGLLQHMAIEQAVPGALPDTDPDAPMVRELAALLPADETQLLYSFALQGRQELALAPDAYAGLAMVLLRLLAFAPVGPVAPAAAGPGNAGPGGSVASSRSGGTAPAAPSVLGGQTVAASAMSMAAAFSAPRPAVALPASRPAPVPVPVHVPVRELPEPPVAPVVQAAAPDTAEPAELYRTALGDRWEALVASLQERQLIAALVRELAIQAQLMEQGEGASPRWVLRVDRESLRSDSLVDKLRAALVTLTEVPTLQLVVQAGEVQDSPARRAAAERERRQHEAERLILNDPEVQKILSDYPGARIVPGSIKPL